MMAISVWFDFSTYPGVAAVAKASLSLVFLKFLGKFLEWSCPGTIKSRSRAFDVRLQHLLLGRDGTLHALQCFTILLSVHCTQMFLTNSCYSSVWNVLENVAQHSCTDMEVPLIHLWNGQDLIVCSVCFLRCLKETEAFRAFSSGHTSRGPRTAFVIALQSHSNVPEEPFSACSPLSAAALLNSSRLWITTTLQRDTSKGRLSAQWGATLAHFKNLLIRELLLEACYALQ